MARKKIGEYEKALKDLQKSILLNPQNSHAFKVRGDIYSIQEKHSLAKKDYAEAVRLAPNLLTAQLELAWLLATCPDAAIRDGDRSIQLATKACEQTNWKDPVCLLMLSAGYAEKGEFETALKHLAEMKKLKPTENKELASDMEELFRTKTPYRESD